MPIINTDIKYYLSGGAGNADPDASLGGAISATEITNNVDENIFDDVTGDEASAGDTEYRCIYVKNTHASLTLQNTKVWIEQNTPSTDDAVEIALGGEGLGGTAETVVNENTAPVGESFSAPANKASGLSLGNIPAGSFYPIWIKRIVNASAVAYNANSFIIKVEGDTNA